MFFDKDRKYLFDVDYDMSRLKIISGGQTGVDQAGLYAAKFFDIPTGGWAPKGWRTQDGNQQELLSGYDLVECEFSDYATRTELNVRDSDVTIRLAQDFSTAGSHCTYRAIKKHKKPHVDISLGKMHLSDEYAKAFGRHIYQNQWYTINIAGNSEKTAPGIGPIAERFLITTFCNIKAK